MYDLIIIGGGPSGSAAGRSAGTAGLETLIIEKEMFPRYKPCGGGLSEHAMSYLDFSIPQRLCEKNIFGARIHFKGQVIERHKMYRVAISVTRSALDNYLLEKAMETGIELRMGEKVIEYIEEPDFVEVRTNKEIYKSKFVIISEGSQGKFKQRVIGRRDRKDEYGICLVTEIEEDNSVIDKYIYNSVDIHFGVANLGYGWIFPHKDYYSVGIGGTAKYMKNPKKIMVDFLNENGFKGDYEFKAHLIPTGGIKRNLVSSRVILSGDAAGFVDSFSGEGIAYAIRSGQIAVKIIARVLFQNESLSKLKDYGAMCQLDFGDNLKYSLMVAKVMHSYPNLFFKIFTSNDEVVDKYLDVMASKITYKDYFYWLIPRIPKNIMLKKKN